VCAYLFARTAGEEESGVVCELGADMTEVVLELVLRRAAQRHLRNAVLAHEQPALFEVHTHGTHLGRARVVVLHDVYVLPAAQRVLGGGRGEIRSKYMVDVVRVGVSMAVCLCGSTRGTLRLAAASQALAGMYVP